MAFVAILCGAVAGCNDGADTNAVKKWRTVEPRLEWNEVRASCDEKIETRDQAIALLVRANGDCLDRAVAAVSKHSKEDLAAAFFIRSRRKNDPVSMLRALDAALKSQSDAARFNRALIQQQFGLTREAQHSWSEVLQHDAPAWKSEARKHLERVQAVPPRWSSEKMAAALERGDTLEARRLARAFPKEAMDYFETSALIDLPKARLLAGVFDDPFARAVVDAASRTHDRSAFEKGVTALQQARYTQAAELLEHARNPLQLLARQKAAGEVFRSGGDCLSLLEPIISVALDNGYRDLATRTCILRAVALEGQSRYFEALQAYDQAFALNESSTRKAQILSRRTFNYSTIGRFEEAFRDALAVLPLLSGVTDLDAIHQGYAAAARAARDLGFPAIALQFQNAGVELIQRAITHASADEIQDAKHHYAIALRERADIHIALGHDALAEGDLVEATESAKAADSAYLPLLNMRLSEVRGHQAFAKGRLPEAVQHFTEAIERAPNEYASYRAHLYYKRGLARGTAPESNDDLATALALLRDEAIQLRNMTTRGHYEALWKPYFSRFQSLHHEMIERHVRQKDVQGAFLYAEQARGFEPLQLLLQTASMPSGFRRIDSMAALEQMRAAIPEDTLILQYLVLEDKTYSWALSREGIIPFQHGVGRTAIRTWVENIHTAIIAGQNVPATTMRAVYDGLFSTPLAGLRHRRVVIVPDGPMHGLPFAALESQKEGYVIARRSIAVAGSTSLYLYSTLRDRQFSRGGDPSVLIVGDPALADTSQLQQLANAAAEARQLHAEYPGSDLLLGDEASIKRFLTAARNATIIHFAGHAVANPYDPWLSRLILAPEGNSSGDLTAERLLTRPEVLSQTRLIVLAACSTASGESIGPEGLAPLVRPLIAAGVPAVVGTLWDVKDSATTRELLVSFHRHYRNGDEVAVALRKAQLEMLRDKRPARAWAAFQAVGYADSPYAPRTAQEEKHSELHRKDSLHRPDGLRSQ